MADEKETLNARLQRLQKELENAKKDRQGAESELTEITDVLKRLKSGQNKHQHELDQEQRRQDEKKKRP